jgi:glycosyltransferase involved in cell wall biosynthesis
MRPLLSIIIPTKNRYDTLMPVVSAISAHIRSPGLEIVVEDNSDVPVPTDLDDLLARDVRIVYHHDALAKSIVDNTVCAIEHSSGEHLTFIGDDDFVSPYILDVTHKLAQSGLDCLIFPPARYWWSSVKFAKETRFHKPRAFWLPRGRSARLTTLDSNEQLRRLLAVGGTTYGDMPRFYHGIVTRRALDSIRASTGTYLPGSSPDMAYSVALAMGNPRHLHIDYPVTVFGASKNSGGGWTAARRHFGRIEDQAHLPPGILDRWNPRLPRFWSELTIYPQTIHEVLAAYGRSEHIAYDVFYAALLVNEPHMTRMVLPLVVRYCREDPSRVANIALQLVRKSAGRMKRAVQSRSALMPYDLFDFATVVDAMDFMRDGLSRPV